MAVGLARVLLAVAALLAGPCGAWHGAPLAGAWGRPLVGLRAARGLPPALRLAGDADDEPAGAGPADAPQPGPPSLEEKMKSWEATEEEQKAATLGGLVPGKLDGFELTLNLLFPLILVACLAVAFFPLLGGFVDPDSAGPIPQ